MDTQTAIETMIYKSLSQNQNIIGLVGSNPTNPTTQYQIYNGQAPIKAPYPLVVFNETSGEDINDTPSDAYCFTYRITTWAYDKPVARALIGYVRDTMNRKQMRVDNIFAYQILTRARFTNLANVEGNQVYGYGINIEFLLE